MKKSRYIQKLNDLKDRIEFIKRNIGEEESFIKDRILRKAVYKEFQECVGIITDISAMLVKDLGFGVEDDYKNMQVVCNKLGLGEEQMD